MLFGNKIPVEQMDVDYFLASNFNEAEFRQ
jgi:hypothetical protein